MTEKTIRREDARLLEGKGRYSADWNLPGQLYGFFLRSDRAHAEIVSIDAKAATARKGVRLLLTGADYAASGWKALPGGVSYEGVGGQKQKKPFWPALAQKKVHYVGQPLALVVAESAALAQDAAEEIAVEYRDLPAVIGFEGATRPGAPQLHEDIPGNLAFEYETGDAAAVQAAFAGAALKTRLTVRSQRLVGNPIEPRAFLASFDAGSGVFTVYSPSQGLNGMRGFLAAATGLPGEKIRVVTELVGGSFGIRSFSYAEHVAVMLAAQQLGQPVKWVATRSEIFLSDNHGRGLTLAGELALDRDGSFLALRFDDGADLGAFSTPFGPQIGSRNITITMGGVYRVPAMHARTRCAYSNAVPVSAYRGAGRPDIACVIERLVDRAAAEHGFDPVALRRKNFIPPEAMPYRTANGTTYDCGEFEAVMDKALLLADWKGFPARRERSKREGKLRGIGIATFLEASAAGVAAKDQAYARFDASGILHVSCVSQSTGQGHETAFVRILCEGLGVTDPRLAERIRIHEGNLDLTVVGNGTGGSRSLYGAGSAVKLLGPRLIETAKPHAAAALGADAVEYGDGKFEAGSKSIGFFDLAQRLAGSSPHPMDCVAEGSFGATFPNGCHIAEVEIDPETGVVDVVSYATVDDIGNVVDHTSVEGQVHGGVLQGVGQVLAEHAIYDSDTGQLLSGSFMDYPMPRADWMRAIRCEEHPVPTKANALGAKGVGESGTSGALGATMNAILNAVRPAGVKDLDMPVTPDRLWRALNESRKRSS
ncbi:MAG TPA: xanthine dehydrogenase family protein molybdopterin-binding subunit [Burkholderiales bacterium]|nr:xanthine dehydrogenase family protein molybdopterin-binding subunit [Burkholderiales bacterium]